VGVIRFLSVQDVPGIHASAIEVEGGLDGLRDLGLLESAVMMPQQQFGGRFLHESIFAMAAAYLFHIASNHPFNDGNKRAGSMAAYVFLDVNGHELTVDEDDFERTVLAVASGRMGKEALIEWFGKHVRQAGRRKRK